MQNVEKRLTVMSIYSMNTAEAVFMLVGEGGFEPPKASPADLQSVPFGHSGIPPYELAPAVKMELVDGLEPPTC